MNRRGFFGALGAAIAGATLDPERLLWTAGRKLISIPSKMHVREWHRHAVTIEIADTVPPFDFNPQIERACALLHERINADCEAVGGRRPTPTVEPMPVGVDIALRMVNRGFPMRFVQQRFFDPSFGCMKTVVRIDASYRV